MTILAIACLVAGVSLVLATAAAWLISGTNEALDETREDYF